MLLLISNKRNTGCKQLKFLDAVCCKYYCLMSPLAVNVDFCLSQVIVISFMTTPFAGLVATNKNIKGIC